ncbi:hypothetical protein DOTSEDRAFT_75362 [Dothistroma septosporum NZE10]|uniref:Uncharacterized protein n=1 Tax=Dothistroma septosporum (strain NZE10 / CBS 128990) TaxID=675120 RepID=M2XJP8_DOTSN|nr:hypothetical protein DOTSEDRAFT_75362 [Dothistroma septosporum NZE10]
MSVTCFSLIQRAGLSVRNTEHVTARFSEAADTREPTFHTSPALLPMFGHYQDGETQKPKSKTTRTTLIAGIWNIRMQRVPGHLSQPHRRGCPRGSSLYALLRDGHHTAVLCCRAG